MPQRRVAQSQQRPRDTRRVAVLTLAGADSGGGAGIAADLRTIAAFGLHGVSAITAVTAQNTRRVQRVFPLSAAAVRAQLDALAEDFRIGAVKIGMLGSRVAIEVAADWLASRPWPVVLDPVLVSTSGTRLLPPHALRALRAHLLPRADVLTPNLPEAAVLLRRRSAAAHEAYELAAALAALGARAVLVKGGHGGADPIEDVLRDAAGRRHVFRHARLPFEARGTGCTLAAGIAAGLALGLDTAAAVRRAERHLQRALRGAYVAGRGPRVLP